MQVWSGVDMDYAMYELKAREVRPSSLVPYSSRYLAASIERISMRCGLPRTHASKHVCSPLTSSHLTLSIR